MHLKSTLIKQADVYTELNHDTIYRIYILCIHPSYQQKGLGSALVEACIQMTAIFKLPAIAGIFTSGASQSLATNLGFKILSEIRYSRWIINDRVIFNDPGLTNYSATFMTMILPGNEVLEERRETRKSIYKSN